MQQRFKLMIPTRIPRTIGSDGQPLTWMDGPSEEHTFDLDINLESLKLRLGRRAKGNATGLTREMSGLIVCKHIR